MIRIDRTALSAHWNGLPIEQRLRVQRLAVWTGVITLAFSPSLWSLIRLAAQDSLHSHLPLIPLVSIYLLFTNRGVQPAAGRPSLAGTALMGLLCAAALAGARLVDGRPSGNVDLALTVLAYISAIAAGGFLFMGARWMAAAAFPIAFLLFMVPLPDGVVGWIEDALVIASADVSAWMIRATGTPLIRDGTVFTLPTIVLQVARECSGIRSTWVLLIVSLLASHTLLKSPWRRFALVAFVVPLGIVRNGFRILTIALLCVHVGPHMVDSFIHHRGGPIFFVLSLGPLFLFLRWLQRHDRSA